MQNFVQADRNQPYLLPPDLREWLPDDDLAHFVVAAVERVPLGRFRVNARGTGSAQYHPRMMLALLVYCYANGIFSSRRIERASYRDIGVRYVMANTHPDHDTICKFRRENLAAVQSGFVEVLLLAKELQLLQVGRVSVDGSKVDANASKRRSIRYDRAVALRAQLGGEVKALLAAAERADGEDVADPQQLPEELARREQLAAQLDAACARLEKQAKAQAERARAEYERKVAAREARTGRGKGRRIKPPAETPKAKAQVNLTDADSGLMRKNKRSEYRQAYNAQAVVDADGSQLVLGARVSRCASDRNELVADVDSVPAAVGTPTQVLADNGYATGTEVKTLTRREIDVLVAVGTADRRRPHDFRPLPDPNQVTEPKPPKAPWRVAMQEKLSADANRDSYRLRQQTVEPVFGIIKQAMGFRQFLLRGHAKVTLEWQLLTLAYNCKRLHNLQRA